MAMKCPNCGAENPEDNRYCGDCGSAMFVSPSVAPSLDARTREVPPYRLRINIMCLVGSIIGILALFMTWAVLQNPVTSQLTNLGAFDFNGSFQPNFGYCVILFLVGTIISFFFTPGGFLQLIGGAGFMLSTQTYPTYNGDALTFSMGLVWAVGSSVIVIGSFLYPIGVGYRAKSRDAIERLLTVSITR
jgi:hypothetical protein